MTLKERALNLIGLEYIASKAPTDELREDEAAMAMDREEKGLTVFYRNRQDQLCMMGYQIKGFFKGALLALKAQCKISAPKSKIDNLVFVEPRYIPITRDGQPLRDEDDILERPPSRPDAHGRAGEPGGQRAGGGSLVDHHRDHHDALQRHGAIRGAELGDPGDGAGLRRLPRAGAVEERRLGPVHVDATGGRVT